MPDSATPAQGATGTQPRQSPDGAAYPLPADVRPWRRQAAGRFRAAISQMRGMARRARRHP